MSEAHRARTILRVTDLSVAYGPEPVVRDAGFRIEPGEIVGLVGESGSGKTRIARALCGLLEPEARLGGAIEFEGRDMAGATEADWRRVRGGGIGYVFQNALGTLNPYRRIGDQLRELLRLHRGLRGREAIAAARRALAGVRFSEPDRILVSRPHQLSGGMRQRVALALALAGDPRLLIADEPTTALDVTVQAGIVDLLRTIRDERGTGILFVTHDLPLASTFCDRLMVMAAGRIVEDGPARRVIDRPESPAARELLAAVPRLGTGPATGAVEAAPVLSAEGVTVDYREPGRRPFARRAFRAVEGVDIEVRAGETVGLVGESGCGKSSLARALLRLEPAAAGTVRWRGEDVTRVPERRLRRRRDRIQPVFQDPVASLSPRRPVGRSLVEGLAALGREKGDPLARIGELMETVGLDPARAGALPEAFSGGQCQRLAIARALAPAPGALVCDEPLTALDVTVQRRILDLLERLQRETGVGLLLVAHDLAVVSRVAHRVHVMYHGRVMESGPSGRVFAQPAHPYTRMLLDAVPRLDGKTASRPAEPDAGGAPEAGCVFAPRCGFATGRCRREVPPLRPVEGRRVACHHAETVIDSPNRAPAPGPAPADGSTP